MAYPLRNVSSAFFVLNLAFSASNSATVLLPLDVDLGPDAPPFNPLALLVDWLLCPAIPGPLDLPLSLAPLRLLLLSSTPLLALGAAELARWWWWP